VAQQYRVNEEEGRWEIVKPIARTKVIATSGDRHFETTTADDGKYSFSGIPPGKYTVHIIMPDKLSPVEDENVEVHNQGCAEIDYRTFTDGRIIGRLLNTEGRSAGVQTIDLKPVRTDGKNVRSLYAISDSDGSFEFKDLPPGRYIMAINLNDAPSKDLPYPKTFYPASTDESEAKVFVLEEGQHIANVEFRLPPPLIERQVTGVIVWPDGRPAVGAEVSMNEVKSDRLAGWYVKTDSKGHFTLNGYEGLHYRVQATIPADPNWKPESGQAVILLATKSLEVAPSEKSDPVRLVIETDSSGSKRTKTVLGSRPSRPRA